jgi:hypothetical protein
MGSVAEFLARIRNPVFRSGFFAVVEVTEVPDCDLKNGSLEGHVKYRFDSQVKMAES